jgi:hypothetical protein
MMDYISSVRCMDHVTEDRIRFRGGHFVRRAVRVYLSTKLTVKGALRSHVRSTGQMGRDDRGSAAKIQ